MASSKSDIARRRKRTATGEFAKDAERPGTRHPADVALTLDSPARDVSMRDRLEQRVAELDRKIESAPIGSVERHRLEVTRATNAEVLEMARQAVEAQLA